MTRKVGEQLSYFQSDLAPMAPIRRQYLEQKRRYPDAILLFRLGDFYETFEEDARTTAKALDIALTSREMGRGVRLPMAGIPVAAAEGYIARLISQGYRVAICEQVGTEPRGGVVDRAVVRVISPGTVVEDGLLSARANNFLAALLVEGDRAGLAYVDVSTGYMAATEVQGKGIEGALAAELARIGPSECLLPQEGAQGLGRYDVTRGPEDGEEQGPGGLLPEGTFVTWRDSSRFSLHRSQEALRSQLGAGSLEGLGLAEWHLAARAAGALLDYVAEVHPTAVGAIQRVEVYSLQGTMVLDAASRRNLELMQGLRTGTVEGSLLGVLDHTRTPMGARLLRRWVAQPLLDLAEIAARQDAVEALVRDGVARRGLGQALAGLGDLERLAARCAQRLLSPRDALALLRCLQALPTICHELSNSGLAPLTRYAGRVQECAAAASRIQETIVDDPPPTLGDGVIKGGASPELDQLRAMVGASRDWIRDLEARERQRTGVRGLKVGYNKVFGYYFEVSTAALRQPTDYYQKQETGAADVAGHLASLGFIRKQSLTGAERFTTPDLKEREALLERAREEMERLEREVFDRMLQDLAGEGPAMLDTARALARVDAILSLAEAAVEGDYCRPVVDQGDAIVVRGGRHPVVERALPPGSFIPNDTHLSASGDQVHIITGPNMAGKSTYLRQVALIVLLAQIGSFVPAREARVGLVDRIFTRIGAVDDIVRGRSTFMVEMEETAAILRNASRRSLVILDEVGRGTSTFDGVAIARAIVEYIHDHPRLGCNTLFATHYHELAELARVLPRVRSFRMDVLEEGDRVVFLHRVVPGAADRSYGVHVARLAGIPQAVTIRAQQVLADLERDRAPRPAAQPSAPASAPGELDPIRQELLALDLDNLTPLEALVTLARLVDMARQAGR